MGLKSTSPLFCQVCCLIYLKKYSQLSYYENQMINTISKPFAQGLVHLCLCKFLYQATAKYSNPSLESVRRLLFFLDMGNVILGVLGDLHLHPKINKALVIPKGSKIGVCQEEDQRGIFTDVFLMDSWIIIIRLL